MISSRSIGAFALALAVARDAGAVGGVLSTAQDPATVVEARFALALSRAQTTRWASLRVERFPGAMAWLLPVRPGARVDEVSDAWFEALEVATAPRVVGPTCGGSAPQVQLERPTVHEPTAAALHITPVGGADELRAFAKEWALELLPETAGRFEALEARGFSFVALVYGGSADRTVTRTVRVTDDAFPAVPLFLTSGPASRSALRVAAFLVAESRTRVGSGEEREIDPRVVSFSDGGTTNYDDILVADLLAHGGKSWVVEAADHAFLFDGVRGPAGAGTSASLVTTYLQRARAYGDATDDPDLALTGLDPSSAWITRVAGVVPAREFGEDLAVTMTTSSPKSPFLVASGGSGCNTPPDGGFVGPPVMPPPVAPDAAPPIGPTFPPGSTTGTGTTGGGPIVREGTPSSYPVAADVSCACSPGADDGSHGDSCDRPEDGDPSSSDGCDGDANSSDDGADDGCDGSSSDGSDDGGGCDGDGSGDDTSGDGCSGDTSHDSSGDGGGCDQGGSSSGGDAKCGVARHKRRGRTRTSAFAFALVAIVFPLRRLTRPRR